MIREPKKKTLHIEGDLPDLPDRPETYRCGSEGIWMGGKFEGAFGCLNRVHKSNFDFHCRMCVGCRNSLCAEFEVDRDSCGPLAVAIDRIHVFKMLLPGLGEVSRREAVRMLVIASQGVCKYPTQRESTGAAKIVAQFPAMMACWPSDSRDKVSEAVAELAKAWSA